MTPAGREHFKQALTANVVVEYKNDSHRDTYVSDADTEEARERLTDLRWELYDSVQETL